MGFTAAQARQLCEQAGAPLPGGMHAGDFEHVRNTKRKMIDGIAFRSTLEARTYQLLKLWEDAGAIRRVEMQPRFVLQPKFRRDGKTIRAMTYKADFRFSRDGGDVVIEAKGHRTQPYMMRKKLFLAKYPEIHFEEWDRETLKRNGG